MNISKINRVDTHLFTDIANTLVYNQNQLSAFIQTPYSKAAFQKQIELKKANYPKEFRNVLVEELKKQYKGIINDKVEKNLALLAQENTFTITTGHQLSLFTGPLYSIFKIMHVIKMCEKLKVKYPEQNFVPVFWMASEDHDFEEINHFTLFGKKITWNSDQKGPVGRFDIGTLKEIREELHEFFKNNQESEIHHLIDSYDGENLAMAHFHLCHELFKDYGLIIIEPDNKKLKELYSPIIHKEIFQQVAQSQIQNTTKELEKMGFHGQVFPREINFFYIEKGFRERIQFIDDHFFIEGKGNFTSKQMEEMLASSPECFSPNVIFRPIYQETILPNLCYVGGGGEMAYWLQLKEVFEKIGITYPLIQVRNSLQLLDSGIIKKMEKLQLSFSETLKDVEEIKKDYILRNASDEFDFVAIESKIKELKELLVNQISPIDPQLKQFVDVEINKLDKQLEGIHTKVIRTQKQKMDTSMKQIEQLKEKLFPEKNLQERVDNFLNFCPSGDYKEFLENIYQAVEPFEKDFIVVEL